MNASAIPHATAAHVVGIGVTGSSTLPLPLQQSDMLRSRTRRLAWVSGAVFLALGNGLIGYCIGAREHTSHIEAYAKARAQIASYQSGNLADGYVLLAGDSHVELAQPDSPSCGRKLLNAGVSGAKADDYLIFLDALSLSGRPSVAVVTLGTNHLFRKRDPSSREALERYEADLSTVVTRLSRLADRIVVAAVPPLAASQDATFDHDGVLALTKRQAALCARLGCETADPYASYRGEDFGIARSDATRDGLHLAEYATAYRAIDRQMCR